MNDPFDRWAESWLPENYSGAPDECGWHSRNGQIVKLEEGECPNKEEHSA